MTFDERVVWLAKWLAVVVLFFVIVMPFQVIWFILLPWLAIYNKKQQEKNGVAWDIHAFTPIEFYGNLVKRIFGID